MYDLLLLPTLLPSVRQHEQMPASQRDLHPVLLRCLLEIIRHSEGPHLRQTLRRTSLNSIPLVIHTYLMSLLNPVDANTGCRIQTS